MLNSNVFLSYYWLDAPFESECVQLCNPSEINCLKLCNQSEINCFKVCNLSEINCLKLCNLSEINCLKPCKPMFSIYKWLFRTAGSTRPFRKQPLSWFCGPIPSTQLFKQACASRHPAAKRSSVGRDTERKWKRERERECVFRSLPFFSPKFRRLYFQKIISVKSKAVSMGSTVWAAWSCERTHGSGKKLCHGKSRYNILPTLGASYPGLVERHCRQCWSSSGRTVLISYRGTTHTHTCKHTHTHTHTHTQRRARALRERERHTHTHAERERGRLTHTHAERQTDRQTEQTKKKYRTSPSYTK